MIYVESSGGLGNQLFFWAFAHHLRIHYSREISLIFSPKIAPDRPCELVKLKNVCEHSIQVKKPILINNSLKFLDKFRYFFPRFPMKNLFVSEFENIDQYPTTSLGKSFLYRGFFQNTHLVNEVGNLIKPEIFEMISRENRLVHQLNLPINYQAIHIRRGDYTKNSNHYGVLSFDYYRKILNDSYETVICTDDELFERDISTAFPNARILGPSKSTSWETLSLLAHATRLIMANSSLSWWAGYIVSEKSGEVIAPTPWFKSSIYPNNLLYSDKFTQMPAEFE